MKSSNLEKADLEPISCVYQKVRKEMQMCSFFSAR